MELLLARNPDPDSRLGYLLRLPIGAGLLFRTAGTWPRTSALYCHPVPLEDWPAEPELVERAPLRTCVRRGAAIDLVLDRARENRSQLVFTHARGRDVVFWQSARTRKKARPLVRPPTARAAGLASLEIVVDSREQYPYRFSTQAAQVVRRALAVGDYGLTLGGRLIASVERKSLADLVATLTSGRLGYVLADLAALPRAGTGRRRPLLRGVQAPPRPRSGRARRASRDPGSLPERAHRLRRDPPAGRGVGLPFPVRGRGLGRSRGGFPRAHRSARHRARNRAVCPAALHRRAASVGPRAGLPGGRSRSAATRDLGGLAGGDGRWLSRLVAFGGCRRGSQLGGTLRMPLVRNLPLALSPFLAVVSHAAGARSKRQGRRGMESG